MSDSPLPDSALLQNKLAQVARGAVGFRVVGVVYIVLGCITLGVTALGLLQLLQGVEFMDVLASSFERAKPAVNFFIIAWLARRAADAFDAVGALIRELGDIV